MADSLQPIIPRDESHHGSLSIAAQDPPEPVPITEQEVGEYREQDRFLPVGPIFCWAIVVLKCIWPDSQCLSDNESLRAAYRQNCERRERMCTGMRLRIHLFHHFWGSGEVPAWEAQDNRRRGYSLCDGNAGFRPVCGDVENSSRKASPGEC